MKNYYFKENLFKITDHYPILDDDGREVYYVDQDFTFIVMMWKFLIWKARKF